jgi:uncharacterized membrane protein (DUF4010 family)
MGEFEAYYRVGLALGIGLLIGLERGWQERGAGEGQRTAGVRTFGLIGLLGAVTAMLAKQAGAFIFVPVFAAAAIVLAIFMWRETQAEKTMSATSFIAAVLTFALGSLAILADMGLTAAAGVSTAVLLAARRPLHGWVAKLKSSELRAIMILAAMTFVLLPILPREPIDPWNAIVPHDLWLLVILVAVVSFAGYGAIKYAGPRRGIMWAAAAGGLFASTAVAVSFSRLARSHRFSTPLLAGAIGISGSVMMMRVLAISLAASSGLLAPVLLPVLLAAAAANAAVSFVYFNKRRDVKGAQRAFLRRSPIDLSEVLKFGLLLGAMLVISTLVAREFGGKGLLWLAAASGLADVDAISLSLSRISGKDVAVTLAGQGILLAVAVNTLTKCGLAMFLGTGALAQRLGLAAAAALTAGAVSYALFVPAQ